MVMETAATILTDCDAWFGYCGDAKALRVDMRVGYIRTAHPYLIVKWMRHLHQSEMESWIADVTKIGPF